MLADRFALRNPDLLTYEQVARAADCSLRTVRRAVDAGEIRATEIGRFRRITKGELARLLQRNRGRAAGPTGLVA